MYHPSTQSNFYDPMSFTEMYLYNGVIMAFFFLISFGTVMFFASCVASFFGFCNLQVSGIESEMGMFIASAGVAFSLSVPGMLALYVFHPDVQTGLIYPITAFQWYWTIGWSDFESDLTLSGVDSGPSGIPYLLDTVDGGVVPVNTDCSFCITSNDVLHAFSLPSVFLKCDAVPGRLNLLHVNFMHPGLQYGQCSELCGVGHSYMPLKLEVVELVSA
uniref:cytochrome-c oxidase n=1 Tax=Thetys vagina TaxID=942565 RepID=A0AA86IMV7_9UROC|nr:cytochrome c oxidase subunit II [Thetys vagina]